MGKLFKNSWALFLGMGLIMMAHGFQGSLLGVRAVAEEFSLASTGFMMSGYFVGYFIGARTIPNIISGVGHIRVFAAFASVASLGILVHSIFINPFTWFVLRVINGFCMVSIFTIAENTDEDYSDNYSERSDISDISLDFQESDDQKDSGEYQPQPYQPAPSGITSSRTSDSQPAPLRPIRITSETTYNSIQQGIDEAERWQTENRESQDLFPLPGQVPNDEDDQIENEENIPPQNSPQQNSDSNSLGSLLDEEL